MTKKLILLLLLIPTLAACSNDGRETPRPEAYEPDLLVIETEYEGLPEAELPSSELYSEEPSEPVVPDDVEEPSEINEGLNAEDSLDALTPLHSNINGAIHRVQYGDNVAYIFGTLHAGHAHWFPLAPIVEDALSRADVVAMEVAEIAGGEAAMAVPMLSSMFLPDGNAWDDILPEAEYNHLVAMAEAWGIPYGVVNRWNPNFFVYHLTMTLMMEMSELDFDIDASVDSYIAQIATERDVPVIGLESIEQQMDIVFNPPFEVMLASIMHLLSPDDMIEYFMASNVLSLDEMAYHYESNNFSIINADISYELGVDSTYADCLYVIYMRDMVSNWRSTYYANAIARLLTETDEPTTFFVAVGLSHIIRSGAGEEFTDIVYELQLMGFYVDPIWERAGA